jgi:hypothetical protein
MIWVMYCDNMGLPVEQSHHPRLIGMRLLVCQRSVTNDFVIEEMLIINPEIL